MNKVLLGVALIVSVAGCSMTLPVSGRTNSGDETFSGSATGYMDGGGVLKLVSSKGLSCEGDFVYTSSRRGEGVFTCSDGQSGSFEFVSTGTKGNGKGDIGGRPFTFRFG